MGEKTVGYNHDPASVLIALLEEKKEELSRFTEGWGDEKRHRLSQEIKDLETQLDKLGVEAGPKIGDPERLDLLKGLQEIAEAESFPEDQVAAVVEFQRSINAKLMDGPEIKAQYNALCDSLGVDVDRGVRDQLWRAANSRAKEQVRE